MNIKLANINVHKGNRSHEKELDDGYITSLAANVELHGLMHPVTLLRLPDGAYAIVAGAHRVAALRKLRGEDGYLNVGEYTLMPDGTTDKEAILASIAENALRHDSTPLEQARYTKMLIEDECLTRAELSEALGISRQAISGMINLVDRFDELPPMWQRDLRQQPDAKTSVTATHWLEVQAKLPKNSIPEALKDVMTMAWKEGWSARKTATAVEGWCISEGARLSKEKMHQSDQTQPKTVEQAILEDKAAAEPDYNLIKESLQEALIGCGCDEKVTKAICNLIAYCDDASAGLVA